MEALIFPFLVFLVSLLLTWVVRLYALKYRIMDTPNERSSHEVPTPRGGGVAIVISFVLALVTFFFTNRIEQQLFTALFLGGGLIAIIGFIDDCRSLSSRIRFLIHISASLVALYCLQAWEIELPGLSWGPAWLKMAVLCFFLVWILNLYNFMDGIDGIAGTETISVAMGMALIVYFSSGSMVWVLLLLCLAGATAGFLVWNWPPAKIFMGDSASGYLGFSLGLLLIASMKELHFSPWPWLIMLAVFLVDATYTLLIRMKSGQKWYAAHRSHAYQIASRKYGSHKKITLTVLLINIFWLFPLACLVIWFPDYSIPVTLLSVVPLLALTIWLGAGHTEE